jgi:hypothetical protein
MLRQGGSLDAGSQRALAELVDEMTSILETEKLPDAELAHLTQTTAHMEKAIGHQQDQGVVGTVRNGLERSSDKGARWSGNGEVDGIRGRHGEGGTGAGAGVTASKRIAGNSCTALRRACSHCK